MGLADIIWVLTTSLKESLHRWLLTTRVSLLYSFFFSIDFQKAATGRVTLVVTAWWTVSMNTFSKTRNRRTHFDQKNGKFKNPLGQHFPKAPKSDNILRQFLFTVWSLELIQAHPFMSILMDFFPTISPIVLPVNEWRMSLYNVLNITDRVLWPIFWLNWLKCIIKLNTFLLKDASDILLGYFNWIKNLFLNKNLYMNVYSSCIYNYTMLETIKIYFNRQKDEQTMVTHTKEYYLVYTEHSRIDAFELWGWKRLLTVPWTARRSNQSILKEISPEYSLERLMLKLKLQ